MCVEKKIKVDSVLLIRRAIKLYPSGSTDSSEIEKWPLSLFLICIAWISSELIQQSIFHTILFDRRNTLLKYSWAFSTQYNQ